MAKFHYRFVSMGASAELAPNRIYLDVGNSLGSGVIDHHQASAPNRCTAALVLEQADAIRAQVHALPPGQSLEIVTHRQPDLDAITAAYFVESLVAGRLPRPAADIWAEAVCDIDRGHTRLDPAHPITPYAVFLARLELAERNADQSQADGSSLAALGAGKALVGWMLDRLEQGVQLDQMGQHLTAAPEFQAEVRLIHADLDRYRRDLARAERLSIPLPKADDTGSVPVPGLWIEGPESLLFKAWARGDTMGAEDPRGYVFTAVQLSPTRIILSVQPGLGLWLKGLGEVLEAAETEKRRQLGCERQGEPRPGYAGPDPWYDGRSPLHGYTIVDAPHDGTILTPAEVRVLFDRWSAERAGHDNDTQKLR